MNGLTHFIGAILSVIGTIGLLALSIHMKKQLTFITFLIFGISLVLLYSASTIYHWVNSSDKVTLILKRIDHSMIYVLIAGTYTPVCLVALKDSFGLKLFIGIWSLAIIGIILKIFWIHAPRWLYTMFYVGMGWLSVFMVMPLAKVIHGSGVAWLVAGGVAYTIGAVIYATKWPKITFKNFGFHEIFHLFVIAGSMCHYWVMFRYILNI
jgi:hemolysin III